MPYAGIVIWATRFGADSDFLPRPGVEAGNTEV
jgi:hypothetical protein